MSLHIQRLAADVLPLSPFASAALGAEGPSSPDPRELEGLILPRGIEDIPRPEDRFDPEERGLLAATLEERLAPLAPPVAVLDSVRALARAGAACVVTGQQPGFLCSPLLSLYKGLHAVRLARSLTQAFECPVVPIFWNHGDDHDVAEVHHANLINENLDLKKVALAGLSSGRQPLSALAMDEQAQRLGATRELLVQTLRRNDEGGGVVDLFMPRHGETLVAAFTRTMLELLGPFGLVVLEPDWIRPDLSRALAQVVTHDPAGKLAEGAAAMRALGLEPTIDPEGAALVYRVDASGRQALRAGGDGFRYDGEPGSRRGSELAAEIVADPAAWSAGALLRPIAQDLCLPIAAYVGGWAELGYQSQLLPLRRAVAAPLTPLVARASCTLVEPEVAASLKKLETDVEATLRARGVFEQQETPEPEVIADLRRTGEAAARMLLDHKAALAELDKGLATNLARGAGQIRGLVDKLRDKAVRVHQNRTGKGRRHERRVSNSLMPREQPQERVLGPLPFVARHGTEWIGELLEHIAPVDHRHLVATFEETT